MNKNGKKTKTNTVITENNPIFSSSSAVIYPFFIFNIILFFTTAIWILFRIQIIYDNINIYQIYYNYI